MSLSFEDGQEIEYENINRFLENLKAAKGNSRDMHFWGWQILAAAGYATQDQSINMAKRS